MTVHKCMYCTFLLQNALGMDNSSEKVCIKTFPSAGQKVSLSWNGNQVANNSMVSNQQLYTSSYWSYTTYTPLRCELAGYGNASARQWYGPTGAALPSRDLSVSAGYGQVMVQGTGVDLYSGGVSYTTQGVHRCDIVDANGTLYRLYVAIYNDPSQTYATASCEFPCTHKGTHACTCYCMAINQVPRLNYLLYMLPADGPSNFGGIQYRLMTALPVEPAVFQLSYTTTYSPATIVRWTYNGNMANGTTFQVVTDLLLSTYQNVLVVTGKMAGVYTCTVTTTCTPACGSFTGPRSVTASLTIPGTYAGGYFKN